MEKNNYPNCAGCFYEADPPGIDNAQSLMRAGFCLGCIADATETITA